jgi:hypothetical protein
MSAAKKLHHNSYKIESTAEDKKIIEQYVKKIDEVLKKDPNLQRKAALIIETMINSKHNK